MRQQILIDALKNQYREIAKESVLVRYIINVFKITGEFPSAYEIAHTMEVKLDLAQRCLDRARKQLWRGKS